MTYIKPDKFLTLTEFRVTGREVDQATLEEAAGTDLEGADGGRLYVGNCYIEGSKADGYCLTIMNESWVAPLHTLEAILYAFARTEVLPKPDDELTALSQEWRDFCRGEGLACVSADEMPMDDLTGAQRDYIRDFIQRWERASEPPAPITDTYTRALEHALRQIRDDYLTLDECDVRRIANDALGSKR